MIVFANHCATRHISCLVYEIVRVYRDGMIYSYISCTSEKIIHKYLILNHSMKAYAVY